MTRTTSCFVLVALTLGLAAVPAQGAVVINIINGDAAGVGFNDPTIVAPVGGNPGTTIGAQRLNVFNQAAAIWGAALDSSVPINVQATWEALTCTATSAVLGSAGALAVDRDFTLAPFPATWYHIALANRLAQTDLDPAGNDLRARFNVNLGNAGCLTGSFFYYGFDHNEGTNVDFLAVLLHEMGHGLGFQTFTSGTTGAYFSSFPSAYDHFLRDASTGLLWSDPTETDPQRVASAITGVGLSWTGASSDAYGTANMVDSSQLVVTGSVGANGNYYVGTASFGPALSTPGVTAPMQLAVDGTAPVNDACEALVGFTPGNLCVVDRGVCAFTVKAAACQAAGAVGMIVVDNAAGVPPPPGLGGTDLTITIPSVRVTLSDGTLIKANLPATGNLSTTSVRKAGMNIAGQMLLYAPSPFQSGSSVSHWDTSATPNLLMEPAINSDLNGTLDATLELMRDTGWFATLPVELMRFEIE
ncbi:MAG: peptidase [Deltaproteobacteria bacterium]|nr:peptidase [Deltaproteobacteria bacterium]